MSDKRHIVILGAGVIGLTIAHVISTKYPGKYQITIVARDWPDNLSSQAFSSPWAGANWSPFSAKKDEESYERELVTFNKFWEMEPTGLTSNVPYTIYYDEDIDLDNLWYKDFVKEFRVLPPEEVHPEFKGGVKFKTITVNPVKYLPWLKSELLKEGVLFVRKQVQSVGEAAEIAGPNGIVVNATGLGARSLIGVEDSKVYPIRGQTILVDAPEVKECIGLPLDAGTSSDEVTYMIPRVNQGHVIVGGTYQKNNWDLSVNFETARHIWERAAKFHPALKTEKTRIISHNVGLRPAREGGPRIELEHIKLPLVSDLLHGRKFEVGAEQQFPVIHAYGFGGAGYQGSWGAAEEAVAFLEKI